MTRATVQARAMGSYTSHGTAWNVAGRVGHYRLLGWGVLEAWEAQAACHNTPVEIWFGNEQPIGYRGPTRTKEQTLEAKRICAACPVLRECQEWSLREQVPYGVLGGWTERERQQLLKAQQSG